MTTSQDRWRFSFKAVIIWALALAAVIFLATHRFNLVSDDAYNWMDGRIVNHDFSWEHTLTLWDGRWYMGLAKNGYTFNPAGLSNVAFLPLYPALLRGLNLVTHSYALAGFIINFFSLVAAAFFLQSLAAKENISPSGGRAAVRYLLLYPTTIFFAAVYTEALFVALALACFYLCKTNKFWWAALVGFLAALTRVPGVFLVFPFLYYLYQARAPLKKYVAMFAFPAGTLIYLGLQKYFTGDALAFLTAQKNWGRVVGHFNPDHLYWLTRAGVANSIMDIAWGVALLAAIIFIYKKLDLGYALYAAAMILVPLSTGSLLSIGRFGMIVFPIALALVKTKPGWQMTYTIAAAVLATFYTIQFVNGYWAG